VNKGDYLLDKINIKVDNRTVKSSNIDSYIEQGLNYKIFGLFKWPLYIYNLSGKNEKWLNRQLRKMGEAPVLYNQDLVDQSEKQILQYFKNSGYINAEVSYVLDTAKAKKAILNFEIVTGEPYRIYNYSRNIEDHEIDSILSVKTPRRSFFKSLFSNVSKENTSFIKEGMLFDREILNKERQRVSTLLRRNGYYAFNRDYVGYVADTSFNANRVDLEMIINPLENETIDSAGFISQQHKKYYVDNVRILTDFDPLNPDQTGSDYIVSDSVDVRGIKILYAKSGKTIRPGLFYQKCYIMPNSIYNERTMEQTFTVLSSLNALRYVSIKFDEFEEADSMKLNCTILTAPSKKQGVNFDIEGTNSAGDLGFASSMTYRHRNLFKGSELFSARVRGGYEYISSSIENNYWEYAAEASLQLPQFTFPFLSYDFRRKIRATTEFKMSYDQQRRPEYYRSIVSGGWIYHWQDRLNTLAGHTFKLLDVNYMFLPFIDSDFRDKLPETTAIYNYTNQFVVSMGYVYSFNNYDPMERRRNTYSFRIALESAGNILYTMSNLLNMSQDQNGIYQLFGINYSEFLKGDVDFARGLMIDTRNSVAFHVGFGIGYPYGNSKELPFERRYYSGGANSNRGWSVRKLGPGSMPVTGNTSFINQVGDIRFDANIELRSKLFWKFELAFYVDAGNVWTIRTYDYQPSGNFDLERFYKEIAFSYGLGLRFDFDYFLVRLDTGFKAYNPQEEYFKRWSLLRPNLHDNFALHFAVGYPF
jgi:outer membrane protein assembly factor BamA